jgi:hypothetical protein
MRRQQPRLGLQRYRLLQRLITIAAVVVACGLAGSLVAAPLERLILIVPDDAFYYLQIARNLAATGQSTADGFSATNGYHPLWLAVLTSLAAIIPDRELLLRAGVVTSFLLHLVASWLVGARVTQVVGPAWGRTAALCWLLNRVTFLIAMQAMESMLYVVLLLIALGVHLRLAATMTAGELPSRRSSMLYGVSLGAACLARTEGAIVASVALVWLGARLWRTSSRTSARPADVAVAWGLCAAALLLIVLPWPLFSLWQVGTMTQDSAAMKALWADDHFPDAASRVRNVIDTADYFLRHSVRLMWYSMPLPVVTLVPIAIAAAFAAVHLQRQRQRRSRTARAMRAAVVPAAVVGGFYGWTLVERQIWWLGLPWLAMFLTAMLGVVWLVRAVPAARHHQRVVRGVMIAVSMISFITLTRSPLAPYPWQADVLRSQAEIERLIPHDQRIGCFNAGIALYFGTGRIVALDGLVSHAARGYWIERRVDDYLRDAHVRFIADDPLTLSRAQRFSRGPLPIEERRTFPLRGWPTGARVLWAVR